MSCKCVTVADALRAHLAGATVPACAEHDPEPAPAGQAVALNDDRLLAGLNEALGTTPTQPPTAA